MFDGMDGQGQAEAPATTRGRPWYPTLKERIKHTPRVGPIVCPRVPEAYRAIHKLLNIIAPWDPDNYPGRMRMAAFITGWKSPKCAYAYVVGRGIVKFGRESKIAHARAAALARSKAAALLAVAEECEAIARR